MTHFYDTLEAILYLKYYPVRKNGIIVAYIHSTVLRLVLCVFYFSI